MTMTLVKLGYHSKLLHDPGLVQQTPLCSTEKHPVAIVVIVTSHPHFYHNHKSEAS